MSETYQKLLTFSLGSEGYGVSILKIKEIIGMMNIISIPRSPDFIKGIINLREKIIPVMDLRIKFGMEPRKYDEETCIMISQVTINGVQKLLGVIVDSVSEVITIPDDQIEPPPECGASAEHNSILGIGKVKDKVVIVLDVNRVFECQDVIRMIETVKEAQTVKEIQNVQ